MSRKLFISFLGTNIYKECIYFDTIKEYKATPFIQVATLEQIGANDWSETDAVRIFVTDSAKKLNWEKTITERKEHDGRLTPYHGLEKVIDDMHLKADVKAISVADGKDEAEMWQIFKTVFDEIQDGDELYIDLTHAFRYLPMLVLVLSNYSKFLKHITVHHLSYGNWEARDKETNKAPIVDLLPLTLLQDWTSAAADFLDNGRTEKLQDIAVPTLKQEIKEAFLRGMPSNEQRNLKAFIENLRQFTEERQSCRGDLIESGKVLASIGSCAKQFNAEGKSPLIPLLSHVSESLHNRDTEIERILDAVDWCCEEKLFQQAATLLQEGVVSYFCRRHGQEKNVLDRVKRGLINSAFIIIKNDIPIEKWEVDADNISLLEDLVNDNLIKELAAPFDKLKSMRNTFNHAGFQKNSSKVSGDKIKMWSNEFRHAICGDKTTSSNIVFKPVFLNISNHPSALWSKEQISAAQQYGEIEDMTFPEIPTNATTEDINSLAKNIVSEITDRYKDNLLTVHVMGEMTFTYDLVTYLKNLGIRCVASCSERVVQDLGDGKRISQFHFEQFREY